MFGITSLIRNGDEVGKKWLRIFQEKLKIDFRIIYILDFYKKRYINFLLSHFYLFTSKTLLIVWGFAFFYTLYKFSFLKIVKLALLQTLNSSHQGIKKNV